MCSFKRSKRSDNQSIVGRVPSKCFKKCARTNDCVLVSYSDTCELFDYKRALQSQVNTSTMQTPSHVLRVPLDQNRIDFKFESFLGYSLKGSGIQQLMNYSLNECLHKCLSVKCDQASYNFNSLKCKLFSAQNGSFVYRKDTQTVLFDRTDVFQMYDPIHMAFKKLIGLRVESQEKSFLVVRSISACLKMCLSDVKCEFVQVSSDENGTRCDMFTNESSLVHENTRRVISSVIYMKLNDKSVDVNLKYLNSLQLFQSSDFYKCHRGRVDVEEDRFRLNRIFDYVDEWDEEVDENEPTRLGHNRRKRFLGKAWNFIKKVGSAVYDVGKDAVNTVAKTGEAVGRLVTGDVEGAAKAFVEAPLVQDVKNTAESAIEVVKAVKDGKSFGEVMNKVGELGLNAVSVVPGIFIYECLFFFFSLFFFLKYLKLTF